MIQRATRRAFFATTTAVASAVIGATWFRRRSAARTPIEPTPIAVDPAQPMPERTLGKTGIPVPLLGLGGAGQTPLSWDGAVAERTAIALIERALQLGIRYFDTAASYGPSEDYLGRVLPPHRARLFLASKTAARDRDGAWRELERSLQRLQTDYLDLWQLHHVSFSAELDQIFGKQGAIRAIEEAKQQKLIRLSGITGHHEPAVIAEGLRRYAFDTTLMALNAADRHHPRPFETIALPIARAQQVGVIAMKVPAYGRLFSSGALAGMAEAMGYVLSLPGVHCCIIAAETIAQLEHNVSTAKRFQPLSESEMAAIGQRAKHAWEKNTFFRAWT